MADVTLSEEDVLDTLLDACPNRKGEWNHQCEQCVQGWVLNKYGKLLAALVQKQKADEKIPTVFLNI